MKEIERAILVGLNIPNQKNDIEDAMKELKTLAEAAGAEVVGEVIQNRPKIEASTYIGEGKAEEIKEYAENLEATSVIFNNDLSGSQIRNLEDSIGVKIIDRTTLILDIFATGATSMEGKIQVKLAQLKYRLPRLQGFGKALSRTGGGIGTRGPGEQQLESDRRHIRREIDALEEKLKKIEETRKIKRKQRVLSNLPIVSLVGYTNAGKSTILNQFVRMTEEGEKTVLEEDKLFATLDTSHRNIHLEDLPEFILTDTVGFVSNLPTALVEAFHSTLEEINYSDFIVLVVDSSSKKLNLEIETTKKVLNEIGANNIPRLMVYNKTDLGNSAEIVPVAGEESMFISAKNFEDIRKLGDKIISLMPQSYHKVKVKLTFSDIKLISYFKEHYSITEPEYDETGATFITVVDEADYGKYREFLSDEIL